MDNILRRKIGQEADLKVVEHITKDNSGNHLSRIYKLSSMDDLMKGFGINENKPRSQRGGGNAIMPSLPPPPRSSRHDKYKE